MVHHAAALAAQDRLAVLERTIADRTEALLWLLHGRLASRTRADRDARPSSRTAPLRARRRRAVLRLHPRAAVCYEQNVERVATMATVP